MYGRRDGEMVWKSGILKVENMWKSRKQRLRKLLIHACQCNVPIAPSLRCRRTFASQCLAVLRAFIQRRFSCCCCLGCSARSSIAAILRVCSTGWQPPARACTQRATSCALRLSCSTAARLLVERLSRAASTTLRLCHAQAFCAVRGRFH